MVDTDKINDRLDDDGGSASSSDEEMSTGTTDSSGENKDRESKKQKIEKFKKGSGVSSADTSKGTHVDIDDGKEVLMAIANMVLYAEGTARALDDPDNAREEKKKEIADIVYEQMADIISEKQVQRICEKYGIDWEDDIIDEVLENQDYEEKVGL